MLVEVDDAFVFDSDRSPAVHSYCEVYSFTETMVNVSLYMAVTRYLCKAAVCKLDCLITLAMTAFNTVS